MPIALPIRGIIFSVAGRENAANNSDKMSSDELVSGPITAFELLFPLSFILLPFLLALWKRSRNDAARRAKRDVAALEAEREPAFWSAWRTRDLPVLYGLAELYVTGAFPLGPWDVSGLRTWIAMFDAVYLTALCRAGIVPLYVQAQGLGTRKWPSVDEDTSRGVLSRDGAVRKVGSRKATDERPAVSPEQMTRWQEFRAAVERVLDWYLPTYIQSKRRAYFDFLIPVPLTFDPVIDLDSKEDRFVSILRAGALNHDFGVSVWTSSLSDGQAALFNTADPEVALEYGATSHFKALLPFKKDRVLREGTSWAENVRAEIRRRLVDPNYLPGSDNGTDLERRDEELRHDVHYYLKTNSCPVLETPPHISKFRTAIIRIEKRDGLAPNIRLDKFVAQAAWDAGLCHRYGEQAIMGNTRSWLDKRELGDLPGIQQFLFTPTKAETATPRRQIVRDAEPATPTSQDLRYRAEMQKLKTDQALNRARVAREARQERERQRQQRVRHQLQVVKQQGVRTAIEEATNVKVPNIQSVQSPQGVQPVQRFRVPDILDSGLEDEVFHDS